MIVLSLYLLIEKIPEKLRVKTSILFCAIAIVASLATLNTRKSKWYDKVKGNFLSAKHYKPVIDIHKMYDLIDSFEETDRIATQSEILPHLAFRDHIYMFPNIGKADYLLLNNKIAAYPLSSDELKSEIDRIHQSKDWESVIYNDNGTFLFKKKDLD